MVISLTHLVRLYHTKALLLERHNSVPDPDLDIRGGRGKGGLQKILSALRASVWSKNKSEEEGGRHPGPSTGSVTVI